jgi:hypothetical protein
MASDQHLGERLRRASALVDPVDGSFERLERLRRRKRRNERLLAGAVSMALVGGLVAGSLAMLRVRGGPTTIAPAGSAPSHARAGGPGTGSAVSLPAGRYLYIKQTLLVGDETFSTETWWAADGSGRERITCSTQDCVVHAAPDGSFVDQYGQEGDQTFGPGQFPVDSDLSGLSTDPDLLLAQLVERTAEGGRSPEPPSSPGPEIGPGVTAGSVLVAIWNILLDPNGTPDLDAALFKVASGLEGVQVRTGVTDTVGRPATALVMPGLGGGDPTTEYFDPGTSLLMGTAPQGDAGRFVYDRGIVDATEAVPTGDQWLFPPAP